MDESKNKSDAKSSDMCNEDNSTKKERSKSDSLVPEKTEINSAKSTARWTSTIHEEFEKQFEKFHAKVLSQKKISLTKEENENVPTPNVSNDKMDAHSKTLRITKPNEDDFDKSSTEKTYDGYENFINLLRSNGNREYTKVVEINKDLFKMSEKFSLAHCVSEDLKMGSGIAVQFKTKFKKLAELSKQKQTQGGLAILSFPPRFIYYLVTKKYFWEKPTLYTLWNSLTKMQNHVQENSIQQIAIPRIGCGLDLLKWNEVKFMIEQIFKNTDVKITVCNFQQEQENYTAPRTIPKCWIQHAPYPVVEIEAGTMIIYFGSEDGFVDHSMEKLEKKFGILEDYKRGPRTLGQVIRTKAFNGDFVIFGFIVQKSFKDDQVDYVNVQKCAQEVQKFNKKFGNKSYLYLGLDVFKNPPNETMQFDKVLDILRSTLRKLEVYVCYPKDLMHLMPAKKM